MSRLGLEPTVPPGDWRARAARALEEGFAYFDWLTAVDQTDADPSGFDVVTRLLDVRAARRWDARVLRTRVAEGASLESLTCLYPGAAWYEREVYEMFGVAFTGFDDGTGQGLRRLLLSASATQAPLRKSFVLAARGSRPWPGAKDPAGAGTGSRRRRQPPGVPPGPDSAGAVAARSEPSQPARGRGSPGDGPG